MARTPALSRPLTVLRTFNVVVAGTVGVLSLALPRLASELLWGGTTAPSHATGMVGSIWLTVALLSALIPSPALITHVGLFQLAYKGIYLAAVALPAFVAGHPLPWLVVAVWVAWVGVLLPLTMPWRTLPAMLKGAQESESKTA